MFWIPRTRELIGLTTNFELGYWLRERDRLIYGRPDDAYRVDYLDVLWVKDLERNPRGDRTIYRTLPDTVDAALRLVGSLV